MFKFGFEIDETDEEISGLGFETTSSAQKKDKAVEEQPYQEISLQRLLDCLPPLISSSPLPIPLSEGGRVTLSRRDLFDARFQVINEEDDSQKDAGAGSLEFLDAPSDLVHGVYEGGLKTWECSLDLVDYLTAEALQQNLRGKRILEVGCGTSVPSLYILGKLFSEPSTDLHTELHLQDYNTSVFELITFPNIIIAWYMSPASKEFRETTSVIEDIDSELPPADNSEPADIPVTPALKAAFLESLKTHSISLKFIAGGWSSFTVEKPYHVVLSSETIYHPESLPFLVKLLGAATAPSTTCLVAAKVLYFGVGGSVTAFCEAVTAAGGQVKTVWEKTSGVGRKILQLSWP
ncbi:hypothetical protein CYLTODRAFT_351269 [Cylindrobasidium torrendii FP15055 ss-10]|uniref:protein-histidine N-methyltransferase n=1 Tax=Cylindrobasidium torrendii FP15055 ss-10 TaxID=1314674 RepID=A0A0D7BDA7_9AGAR|nr:hypothetical protein CYLTODRAFT_351269 [Cylindrobasidium torrendii FP15055 ss-10]